MSKPLYIPQGVLEALKDWLGLDGIALFEGFLLEHGTVSPVLTVSLGNGRSIPHPVHLREGMQARNFLRDLQAVQKMNLDDISLDDLWTVAVERALGYDLCPFPLVNMRFKVWADPSTSGVVADVLKDEQKVVLKWSEGDVRTWPLLEWRTRCSVE